MPDALPSARAEKPAVVEKKLPWDRALFENPNTIILSMDQDETSISEAWMLKHFGGDDENDRPEVMDRFVNMLDLRSLRKQSVVIALVRGRMKRGGRTNALGWYKAEGGERVTEAAPTEKLIEEVSVCTPIHCAEYWEDSGGRYGGRLKYAEFTSKLGELVSSPIGAGACLKFLDVAARIKGEVPTEVVLRWS